MKTWEITMSSQYSKKEVPEELKNDPEGLSDPEELMSMFVGMFFGVPKRRGEYKFALRDSIPVGPAIYSTNVRDKRKKEGVREKSPLTQVLINSCCLHKELH